MDQLPIEKGCKLQWAPKLYKMFRVNHFISHPCCIEEVVEQDDCDFELMSNPAVNHFLFPEKWYVIKNANNSGSSLNRVTNAIKDTIIDTIWQTGSEKKDSHQTYKWYVSYVFLIITIL